MTDPTHELDEIVVQGQRRRSDGTFPAGPGGGGPGGGSSGGEHQNEVEDPGTQPPEPPPPHPCDHPDARKIWNSDAAAAAAVAASAARAASLNDGSNLGNRELGANLFMNNSGQVDITQIDVGE